MRFVRMFLVQREGLRCRRWLHLRFSLASIFLTVMQPFVPNGVTIVLGMSSINSGTFNEARDE